MAIMHTEPRRIKKIKGNKLKFTWNTNPARSKRHFSKRSCSSTAISAHTFLHSCTKAGKKKSQTIARTSQPHVPTNPHLGSLPSDVNRHGRNSRSSPAAYRYTLEGSHPCSDPRITAGIAASRRSQDLATSSGPPRDRRPPSGGGSPQAASSGASKRGGGAASGANAIFRRRGEWGWGWSGSGRRGGESRGDGVDGLNPGGGGWVRGTKGSAEWAFW